MKKKNRTYVVVRMDHMILVPQMWVAGIGAHSMKLVPEASGVRDWGISWIDFWRWVIDLKF